jgi:NAD(P)-dependent dehydrogenase (short-subunit alcohol dehydrogenase family)
VPDPRYPAFTARMRARGRAVGYWVTQDNCVATERIAGTLRMTRALSPELVASGNGRIVNIGSVAGFHVYEGGGGYTAAKHAARAVTPMLRENSGGSRSGSSRSPLAWWRRS